MGIRNRIKKRLPIFGRKTVSPAAPPAFNDEPSSPSFEPAPYTEPASPRGDKEVQTFLKDFVTENQIVIFMKGSPESPSCGFSANASAILASYGKEFAHFDVFLDQDVREGVKDFHSGQHSWSPLVVSLLVSRYPDSSSIQWAEIRNWCPWRVTINNQIVPNSSVWMMWIRGQHV